MINKNSIMQRWDRIRKLLAEGHNGSEPRDIFENILEDYDEELRQEREGRKRAELEVTELYPILQNLVLQARCHDGASKKLMRACEEAEQLINKKRNKTK